jgi:hypothetical protein
VGAPGTVVPGDVVEVVDPGDVVEVVDPGDVVVVVDPGDVVVVVDPGDVVVVVDPGDVVVVVDPGDVVVVVDPGDVVVVVPVVLHADSVMVLSSRLTWPFLANTRPFTLAPVCTVAEVNAKMLPTNVVSVPSVAELPTCQKTLHAWAPPMSLTVLFDEVIRVDPAWKMNTALAFPSRVTVPVRPNPDVALYSPGFSVCPPRSLGAVVAGVLPAASL